MANRKSKLKKPQRFVCPENEKVDFFANITDNLLFCILILLPDKILQEQAKYVCKRWFHLITNYIFFSQVSFIIQKPTTENKKAYKSHVVSICEGRRTLRVSTKDLDIPCRGYIKSWCNNLTLIVDSDKDGVLYIYNLITKKGLYLPVCNSLICQGHVRCGLNLAFNIFTQEYKVVHVYIGLSMVECQILVFKYEESVFYFSKWENVKRPSWTGERVSYWDDPVSVEGRFLHWDVHSPKYILSMDIVEGEFRKTDLPENSYIDVINGYYLMEISGFLALLVPYFGTVFEVWILIDFENSKWEKLLDIGDFCDVHSEMHSSGGYFSVVPVASLKTGSSIIFKKCDINPGLYTFQVFKSGGLKKLDIQIQESERCVVQAMDERWMTCLCN